jgi:hypothetical protein
MLLNSSINKVFYLAILHQSLLQNEGSQNAKWFGLTKILLFYVFPKCFSMPDASSVAE